MENFINDSKEEQLVDLFDQEDEFAESQHLLGKRKLLASHADVSSSKRLKTDANHHFLEAMPSADMYERSYMHKDTVSSIIVSHKYDFIFTMSVDGSLKFWKKVQNGIEFVKTFRAHVGKITGCSLSTNEQRLATVCSKDQALKIYDVVNFDQMHIIKLKFVPELCEFISKHSSFSSVVAVTQYREPIIHLIKAETQEGQVLKVLKDLHFSSIRTLKFLPELDLVVSSDDSGMIEVWDPETYEFPSDNKRLQYELITSTDFLELAKAKTFALSMSISNSGDLIAVYARDRKIRIFNVVTGKLLKTIEEQTQIYIDYQVSKGTGAAAKADMLYLEKLDFERRMAVEKDIEKQWDLVKAPTKPKKGQEQIEQPEAQQYCVLPSIGFDESDTFVYFGTPVGIKVYSISSGEFIRVIGKVESTERFLQIALYQGKPQKSTQQAMSAVGFGGKSAQQRDIDPTFVCSAFKKNRFYLFTQREPIDPEDQKQVSSVIVGSESYGRDVFNEQIGGKDDLTVGSKGQGSSSKQLQSKAIIFTTMGEIHVELYPTECPKTVENFVTHSKQGYYNNLIFHRVIKSFMIQTGDPSGDGTGGSSIWGGEFEDEIRPNLNHDQPFVLSMANAGPNTNASQFYITTVPCPWLNGKHTVFGRVTRGMEVASEIEGVRVDDRKKPLMDVRIRLVKVLDD